MEAPWARPIDQVFQELSVPDGKGLSSQEATRRLTQYGPNTLVHYKKTSKWTLLLKQLKNPVVYVLVVAALITLALNERLESFTIILIVIINTIIGFLQESKTDAAIEALAKLTAPMAKVLRDGKINIIPSEKLSPGDVLVFEAGDFIPADARIILANQLSVNEATLTGESLPVEKKETMISSTASLTQRCNMLFAGTAISTGSGKAIITATGNYSEIGKIAGMMTSAEAPNTPLQIRLEIVSQKLLKLGMLIIVIVIVVGLLQGRPWIEVLISALSLSIAAIPEGLPTVVTIALVMAVHRMAKKKALVRKMDSVETLGATDIICTDKTGTLTTGKMTVRESYLIPGADETIFHRCLVLCNNATLDSGNVGDTTEIAMLDFAFQRGFLEQDLKNKFPRLYEWSFDSIRKRMSVAVNDNGRKMILTKGAPESVIPRCLLSENEISEVMDLVSSYSGKGMRVLALAWKEANDETISDDTEKVESNLHLLGLVAMADAPRPESREAIKRCQKTGIRIIMITGDHPQTAGAIANELGITANVNARVLTGEDLDRLSDEHLKESVENVSVYARVSPAHKLKLVSALMEKGHIVAMTGDGVNDAPALKLASIGVSMGKGGTEVARQASAMILTDDNFATIVDAVEEGRAVNGNIKRTLQYLLSHNLAELIFILTATIAGLPIPLLPINLLWLNLVTDGFPSLALAGEKVPPHFLEENSGPSEKSFFNRSFYKEMIFVAAVITVMNLVIYQFGLRHYDLVTARSLTFSFMVYVGLFRSFSCRSDTKTFFEMKPNIYLLLSVILPIGFQFSIQYSELSRHIFQIKELTLETNLMLLALASVPVTLVELFKLYRRRRI